MTTNREHQIALREAACCAAADPYFQHRPALDTNGKRRVFDAAFQRGYEAGHVTVALDLAALREKARPIFGDVPGAMDAVEWVCAEMQVQQR